MTSSSDRHPLGRPEKPRESIRDRTIGNRFRDDYRDKAIRLANLERRAPGGALNWRKNLDKAIDDVGTLLFRYKCDESSGDLADTAGYPSGPWDLTHSTETAGEDQFNGDTWDSSHDVTYGLMNHDELGTADDGSIRFNYDQLHSPGGEEGVWTYPDIQFPGAWFINSTAPWWGTSAGDLQLLVVNFLPLDMTPAAGVRQGIAGRVNFYDTNQGPNGYAFFIKENSDFVFWGTDGTNTVELTCPYTLSEGYWYQAAVHWDGTNWNLWVNGEMVDTAVQTHVPTRNGTKLGFGLGMVRYYGNFNTSSEAGAFFYGQVDNVLGYTSLSGDPADGIKGLYAAKDTGTGYTSEFEHITAGSAASPFTVDSVDPTTKTNSPEEYALVSDGAGGTRWESVVGSPGAPGANGADGADGADGATIRHGSGAPSDSLGNDGDIYIDDDSGDVYFKAAGTYSIDFNLYEKRQVIFSWSGSIPTLASVTVEHRVPYNEVTGASMTFTIERLYSRLSQLPSGTVAFRAEKSPGGNSAFIPTTIASNSHSSSDYEKEITGIGGTVSSGDVVRIAITDVGGAGSYSIQLQAKQ